MKQLNIRIDEELNSRLKEVSLKSETSVQDLVTIAIKSFIEDVIETEFNELYEMLKEGDKISVTDLRYPNDVYELLKKSDLNININSNYEIEVI